MYNKANFSVAGIADKSGRGSYRRFGVNFTPKCTMGTNGQALMLVTTPRNAPVAEFPVIQGEMVIDTFAPFMISREDAEGIAKTIPKSRMPILENAGVLKSDNGDAIFVTTDLSCVKKTAARKIEGRFPGIGQISPKGKPVIKFRMGVELLSNLLGAMKKAGAVNVSIEAWDDKSAVRIKANVGAYQKAWALIMPMST
jgi:hypothetical protein